MRVAKGREAMEDSHAHPHASPIPRRILTEKICLRARLRLNLFKFNIVNLKQVRLATDPFFIYKLRSRPNMVVVSDM